MPIVIANFQPFFAIKQCVFQIMAGRDQGQLLLG